MDYIYTLKEKGYTQKWMAGVLGISLSKTNRLKNKDAKTRKYTYLHVARLIKELENKEDVSPLRRILAEHFSDALSDELPKLNARSFPFPFLHKVDLSDTSSLEVLRKYFAKCYLQDAEDIGSSENIIVPSGMDSQKIDFREGYASALLYLLYSIEVILHNVESPTDSVNSINLMLRWIVHVMSSFNKEQRKTAYNIDKDNSTESDENGLHITMRGLPHFFQFKFISYYFGYELIRSCPSRESESFYQGWDSCCVSYCNNFITETDGDLLLFLKKRKYSLLNSIDYCINKFGVDIQLESWENTYNTIIYKFKMEGYEEVIKGWERFIEENKAEFNISLDIMPMYGRIDINEVEVKKIIENTLLCFSDKLKGKQVALYLLSSSEQDNRKQSSLLICYWREISGLMQSLKEYFGTEEIADRQIENFKVDTFGMIGARVFHYYLKLAGSILNEYRSHYSRDGRGKQDQADKTPSESFAAISTFPDFFSIEEFKNFIQSSSEIIDYFSNVCEETNFQFLRLFLRIRECRIGGYDPI